MTSRRTFLQATGGALGAAWLTSQMPLLAATAEAASKARNAETFRLLNPHQAADLDAMAARIVPTDDTPGATEAGAVWYMDQALAGPMAGAASMVFGQLEQLSGRLAENGEGRFATLELQRQDELLREIENGPLFGLVYFMTLCGLFAMPSYGGNRDHIGWQLIGFDHRHAWEPPFGWYDDPANAEAVRQLPPTASRPAQSTTEPTANIIRPLPAGSAS